MFRKLLFCVCLSVVFVFARVEARTLSNIVNLTVPDLELVNQNGERSRFVSDIIGDNLAAITFTYTTCTTVCPVLDSIFQQVQKRLGDQLGKETVLITMSVDPATDIPQRLKAHSEKLDAKPGWYFLTGEKPKVNRVLKALEVYTPDFYNHPPTVLIVDGKRNVWSRINGFPFTARVEKVLDEFRAARAGQ
jgi:protein SCO1/2